MKLGFTFDEKALKDISISDWISKAHSIGANSIELSPDLDILPLSTYLEIAKGASDYGIEINYHIPYFASELYSIDRFSTNHEASKSKYDEFLSLLGEISSVIGSSDSVIVVHGEEFSSSRQKSPEGTMKFLKHLSHALEYRKLSHKIALETLRLGSVEKVGNSRAEVMSILSALDDSRVGVCLDICHDSMNYFPGNPPLDDSFFEKVIYSHIHGFELSSGRNHVSFSGSDLNFLPQILNLKKAKPDITLNLESLSDFAGDSYLTELFSDIELLKSIV